MLKKWNKEKKILFALLLLLLIIIIPIILYTAFAKDFIMKDFQSRIEISLNTTSINKDYETCYGNLVHCEKVEISLKESNVDTSKIGIYKNIYKFEYNKKVKEVEQIVEVKDKESPLLEIEKEEIKICPNGKIPPVNLTAIDNLDGDIKELVTSKIDGDNVIFEVTDSSGNKTEKRIKGIKEDKENPILTLKGDNPMSIQLDKNFEDPGFVVEDNCSDNLNDLVVVTGIVDTKVVGEYKLTYTVKDEAENETEIGRTVYVYKQNNYNAPSGKSVYLTFDDGPSAYTNSLLDVLKKYNVKATFFVTNQGLTKGHDNAIKRAFDEGHTVGLHTYSHNYKSIYASEEAYYNDLYAIQKKVKDITGIESKIIRFPGGSSNTISNWNKGIMSHLTKSVEAKGFRYWDWNVYGGDAGETTSSSKVASNIIKELGNGSTYVVLQHDVKQFSVNAVETIIQFGLSHGYTFRNLTMDSPTSHHRVNN